MANLGEAAEGGSRRRELPKKEGGSRRRDLPKKEGGSRRRERREAPQKVTGGATCTPRRTEDGRF